MPAWMPRGLTPATSSGLTPGELDFEKELECSSSFWSLGGEVNYSHLAMIETSALRPLLHAERELADTFPDSVWRVGFERAFRRDVLGIKESPGMQRSAFGIRARRRGSSRERRLERRERLVTIVRVCRSEKSGRYNLRRGERNRRMGIGQCGFDNCQLWVLSDWICPDSALSERRTP